MRVYDIQPRNGIQKLTAVQTRLNELQITGLLVGSISRDKCTTSAIACPTIWQRSIDPPATP
jgi:hypothetical protein